MALADTDGTLTMMVATPDRFPEDALLSPVRQRLEELAQLDPDWDSYGACPPARAALDGALEFASRVERRFWRRVGERVLPSAISPLPSGGIELEWHNPGELVAVDIGPDGRCGYLRNSGSGRGAHYEEQNDVSPVTLLSVVAAVLLPRS